MDKEKQQPGRCSDIHNRGVVSCRKRFSRIKACAYTSIMLPAILKSLSKSDASNTVASRADSSTIPPSSSSSSFSRKCYQPSGSAYLLAPSAHISSCHTETDFQSARREDSRNQCCLSFMATQHRISSAPDAAKFLEGRRNEARKQLGATRLKMDPQVWCKEAGLKHVDRETVLAEKAC
jgi:hypothetical protein